MKNLISTVLYMHTVWNVLFSLSPPSPSSLPLSSSELGRRLCYEVCAGDVVGVKGHQFCQHEALHGNHSKMEVLQFHLLQREREREREREIHLMFGSSTLHLSLSVLGVRSGKLQSQPRVVVI